MPTRPEVDPRRLGSTPTTFEADRAEVILRLRRFVAPDARHDKHPAFGAMRRDEWLLWGYAHTDHHLRQTSPFPGVSLAAKWRGDSAATSAAVASYNISRRETLKANDNGLLSIAQGGWHYIITGRKELEELYRYRDDPTEARSLVGSGSGNALIPLMRKGMLDVLAAERGTPAKDSTVR